MVLTLTKLEDGVGRMIQCGSVEGCRKNPDGLKCDTPRSQQSSYFMPWALLFPVIWVLAWMIGKYF